MKPIVSIIMGSTSDLPVLEKAAKLFDEFEIPFELNALSAHRTPEEVTAFATSAKDSALPVPQLKIPEMPFCQHQMLTCATSPT